MERPKIPQMSAEVRDDNPYRHDFALHLVESNICGSRLMALKKMGVVENYEVWCISQIGCFMCLFLTYI